MLVFKTPNKYSECPMVKNSKITVLLKVLGFTIDNGSVETWVKAYSNHSNYKIKVDIETENIDYGKKIRVQDKTTSNFKAEENFVVLECVNRLLEKGYKPENIVLEQKWPMGHGTSGKLDVLVTRDNDDAYLMIECKTAGTEFDKAFKRIQKDGGQLFTYFQQDKNADILILYASGCNSKGKLQYHNGIIKIEEDYRQTSNVADFYDRWNKLAKNNGVFDDWVKPYDFESKALTSKTLEEISQKDSSFIFNQFLEILRHNVVSDKPNAFNKIFTLFLCKIYDEKATKPNEELAFQWFYTNYTYDGISYPPDNNISFQKRLTDLYKKGMKEFLDKEVTDISDAEFEKKYGTSLNKDVREKLFNELVEIRLKKNNEFAFKEVYDDESFKDNAKVVKEVVELLQGYKIRYTKKQQYLSDFFEMLLTTGLKQESGQFFTPVPISQFIIKSLPLDKMVEDKLEKGEKGNYLPTIIDYAAGSGHFITESMHEIQSLINDLTPEDYISDTANKIRSWQAAHFEWADDYVYGIEKDYRLVKVGKVGCYLHGDGLAQIIHSDGLANFKKTTDYKGLLQKASKDNPQENEQFDIVISNPPYSVSAFKNNASKYYRDEDFELYGSLTDQSSEIECLFIERTKQLLKEGGLAGIILPSSILSNTGIYTKAREIIFKYFEIVGIAELGSNTFMATGTNTVTLFLRRRDNYVYNNTLLAVQKSFKNRRDVVINLVQSPLQKYVESVWDGLSLEDYWSLLAKSPNNSVQAHEIFKDYKKKIKAKDEDFLFDDILAREIEKASYFILAWGQQVVVVKSGEKKEEKEFLGYEFSNRRGNEGIHPMQRGKTIDECTKLFDPDCFDNPEKASSYIYKAFVGDFETAIDDSLKGNITRHDLIDMMTFDRESFDKTISLAAKKKVKIDSKWPFKPLGKLCDIKIGATPARKEYNYYENGIHPWVSIAEMDGNLILDTKEKLSDLGVKKSSVKLIPKGTTLLSFKLSIGKVAIAGVDLYTNEAIAGLCIKKAYGQTLLNKFLFFLFDVKFINLEKNSFNAFGKSLNKTFLNENVQIPLPPMDVQERIVAEIEKIEKEKQKISDNLDNLKQSIFDKLKSIRSKAKISDLCEIRNQKTNPQKYLDTEFINIGLEDIEAHMGQFLQQPEMLGRNILSTKNVFKKGDVLYGKLRPYLNKVAIAEVGGICSTDILVLSTSAPLILKYILLSNEVVEQTSKLVSGLRMPRIKPHDLMNLSVPMSDEKEQQKIVTEIKKIEAQIVDLQEKLAQIPESRNAVLKKYL